MKGSSERRSSPRPALSFPDPSSADADGLVAIGGDLSMERLLLAYSSGLFPWTVRPVTWWSPDPRGIFEFERFHVPRSLARLLRRRPFKVTVDCAYEAVMDGCAAASAPQRGQTWITPEFKAAYTRLHRAGWAHSLECWAGSELAGGIYGVHVGGFFAGESMFYRVSNASKAALFYLVQALKEQRFQLFDVQMVTDTTEALGAVAMPRKVYLRRLADAIGVSRNFPARGEVDAERLTANFFAAQHGRTLSAWNTC